MPKGSDITPIEFTEKKDRYSVVLPCDPEHFGSFVAGLLGRPQVISGAVRGAFEVDRADIENIYHLIAQHVFAQENTNLISFNIRILYGDSSSVSLDSFEDFLSYNEVKSLLSTGVVLSWIFLVKFRNREAPEKQQVDISLNARELFYDRDGISLHNQKYIDKDERMTYRISHTNRSWGSAVQSLLVTHLSNYRKELNGVLGFFSRNYLRIGLFSGITIFALSIGVGLWVTSEFINEYAAKAADIGLSSNIEIIDKKISILIDIFTSGVWARYSFYGTMFVILAVIVSIFCGSWIGSTTAIERRSFVVLTKSAKEAQQEYPDKLKGHILLIFGSIFGSLILSTSSKIIFYIAKKFLNL